MHPAPAHLVSPAIRIRRSDAADVDALLAIEREAFQTDRISPRGFRRFVASRNATLLVALDGDERCGYALVLYRTGARSARLYSIAVKRACAGRGVALALLAAVEADARGRGCQAMRLEVSERNTIAIARYTKTGYHVFGRHAAYYGDGSDALRFEKRL